MGGEANRRIDTDEEIWIQLDRWLVVQTVGQANELTDGWKTGTDGWTGEQANIQMDGYGYRGMDGQAN